MSLDGIWQVCIGFGLVWMGFDKFGQGFEIWDESALKLHKFAKWWFINEKSTQPGKMINK